MTRDTKLSQDLAALAAAKRQQLGDPPSQEQLIALRDGELPPEEANQIRDRLTIDPELAEAYLELTRDSETEVQPADSSVDLQEVDIDDAWRRLSPKLERETAQTADGAYDDAEGVASFPRRGWPRLLGLAATLTLALGLVWLFGDRGVKAPIPESHFPVSITGQDLRNSDQYLPADATGIAFQIDVSSLDPSDYVVELLDATTEVVQKERMVVEAGQQQIIFGVDLDSVESELTYRLIVRTSDDLGADPQIQAIFTPVFDPKAPGQATPVDACEALGSRASAAKELREHGQRKAAGIAYHEALQEAQAQVCPYQEAWIWNGLSALSILEGQLFEGLRLLDLAGRALTAIELEPKNLHILKASIEFNRAATYSRLGWLDEAAAGFGKVEALYNLYGAKTNDQAKLLLQLARVRRHQGLIEEARSAVESGLEMATDESNLLASLWQESAWLDFEEDSLESAELALNKAVDVLSDASEYARANIFVDLAELKARQGKPAESLLWADRTLELIEAADTPDLILEVVARHVRSVALSALGDPGEAKVAASRGIELLESLRGVWRDQGRLFFAMRWKYYRHRLDLAVSTEDSSDAWAVFERYRARSLLESAEERVRRQGHQGESQPSLSSEIEQTRYGLLETIRELERWQKSDGDAVKEAHEARFLQHRLKLRELQNDERRSAGLEALIERRDSGEAATMLGSGTLGLAFARGVDRFHVLTLSSDRPSTLARLTSDPDQTQTLLDQILLGLHPRAAGEAAELLEERTLLLSRILLAPLEEILDEYRRLVIVADAPLDKLPFEILRHPGTEQRLIESHDIIYLPSLSVLGGLRRRGRACSPPASEILTLADPVFGPNDPRWPKGAANLRSENETLKFHPLPQTAMEAATIAQYFPTAKQISGLAATQDRFLAEAKHHRAIHIASHAESDSKYPERSRIALTCIGTEDVALEACDLYFDDVLTLDLCGQTVVLSACKTAGGLSVEGEGILGLPWAFLRAGASTVIASLWQVPDGTTAELMATFYRHQSEGKNPAVALRLAKLALIEKGHLPSAWAPFILLGDWIDAQTSTFVARPGLIHQTE